MCHCGLSETEHAESISTTADREDIGINWSKEEDTTTIPTLDFGVFEDPPNELLDKKTTYVSK